MTATRIRMASTIEWVIAGVFFIGAIGAGSIALREVHTVSAVMPVSTVSAAESALVGRTPAGVPSRAVSVPVLLLSNGQSLKVGDAPPASTIGTLRGENIEQTAAGQRITRTYQSADMEFVLVLEALRIAAIYVL